VPPEDLTVVASADVSVSASSTNRFTGVHATRTARHISRKNIATTKKARPMSAWDCDAACMNSTWSMVNTRREEREREREREPTQRRHSTTTGTDEHEHERT
jgi:hypothetical protein